MVRSLQQLGVDVWIVTGDCEAAARSMSKYLKVKPDRVLSEILPQHKKDVIADLQKKPSSGHSRNIVAMVGDGVNDSPALAQVILILVVLVALLRVCHDVSLFCTATRRTLALQSVPVLIFPLQLPRSC